MSSDQAEIIRWANTVGGYFTKKEAAKQFPYYCNTEKHIGDRLSRMVNARLLERTKPGHFRVPTRLPTSRPAKKAAADANQTDLFQ